MNFVALCIENVAPSSSGRCSSGVANVESTATGTPAGAQHGRARRPRAAGCSASPATAGRRPRTRASVASVSVVSTVGQRDPARPPPARPSSAARPRVARDRPDDPRARRQRLEDRRRRGGAGRERDAGPPSSAPIASSSASQLGDALLAGVVAAVEARREHQRRVQRRARDARPASGVDGDRRAVHRDVLLTICNRVGNLRSMAHRSHPCPDRADVVIVGGGVVGVSAAFHLAEAGRAGRPARARPARQRLDLEGRRRRPHAVLATRSTSRSPRRSLAAFKDFDTPPGLGDRPARGRLPVPAHPRARRRRVHAQRRAAERARRPDPDGHAGRGARAVPAARGRRRARRQLLAAGRPRDAGGGGPGLRVRRARRSARTCRRSCEVDRIETARRPDRSGPRGRATRSRTDTVICAAGAWSRRCGELAGRRPAGHAGCAARSSSPSRWPTCPPHLPLTIDFATTFYFHREGPGLLIGMSDPTETPGLQHRDDRRLDPRAAGRSPQRRAPRIADAGIQRRLGGPVRHEPGPQRDHRRGRRASAASSTPRASPATASCRARRPASCCATSCCGAPPFADIAPLQRRALRAAPTCAPSTTSSDAALRQRARPGAVQRRRGGRGAARRDRRRPAASPASG